MANENRTYDLKVEKTISKSPAEVFRAIGEGRLFVNCSADHESLKVDFKAGGKYSIRFLSHGIQTHGEFLEVVPHSRIAFTWCQNYAANPTPDTTVVIDLRDVGGKTALTLTHTGFTDIGNRDGHQGGWSGGLDDLSGEITAGKLRLVRTYPVAVEKLYDKCKNPASFFGIMGDVDKGKVDFKVGGKYQVPTRTGEIRGEFLEIIPNRKIVFSWVSVGQRQESLTGETRVTLLFEAEDEKDTSSLELIHEGLETEAQQKAHRAGWDSVLKRLK